MTDVKFIFKNMAILGILIFAIMNWIIIIQSDGNVNQENMITNNSLINDSYGFLQSNLTSGQSSAENSLNSLEDVPPTEYVGDLDVGSMVSTTRTARALTVGLWNIYIKLPQVILGVSPVVAAGITTILLLFLAIGIWAVWKGSIS